MFGISVAGGVDVDDNKYPGKWLFLWHRYRNSSWVSLTQFFIIITSRYCCGCLWVRKCRYNEVNVYYKSQVIWIAWTFIDFFSRCSMIVWVSVVLRTVSEDSDWCFENLSGSHHLSHVNCEWPAVTIHNSLDFHQSLKRYVMKILLF